MTLQMVTANRLIDGAVVYLTASGDWSENVADGSIGIDKAKAADLLAVAEQAVARQLVVAPYLIDVIDGDDGLRPIRFREYIRAFGPPVRPDLGRGHVRR